LTIHEFHRGVKQDKTVYQGMKDSRDFNAWKENINAVTQIDCTHHVPYENHVPKDDREISVSQKIKLLHTLLEECLDMEQGKLQVHPYGEYYENVYHDLKKHALESTMEQLSHDTLFQYMSTISHPGKCCGTMLEVVLYWYEQIKQ
jgi:hypothetical protein